VLKHAVNARLRALRSHKGGQFGLLRKMERVGAVMHRQCPTLVTRR
jgi:hypothetical protein